MRGVLKYLKAIVLIWIIAGLFYIIAGDGLRYSAPAETPMASPNELVSEPSAGTVIEQKFKPEMNLIHSIALMPFTYERQNAGMIEVQLTNAEGAVLATITINAEALQTGVPYWMTYDPMLSVDTDAYYSLRILINGNVGMNPTFHYTKGANTESGQPSLIVNGYEADGVLCMGVTGYSRGILGHYYPFFVAGICLLAVLYMAWADYRTRNGKFTVVTLALVIWTRYQFLIKQLVSRDFKVKYKRSVLGYCWSFLNPVLTMVVQYVIFSQIFRSDIENFPVYLLSGNIMFSFFSEAVGQGLMSIIGNASLITKVYVPKYIWPATKVFSCSINLFISVIPLLIVTLITGERINLTILLLPYALICLLIFTMGLVFLLSAINVFFRDVQYLWGIVSMIWMYATPIFYPANIVPDNLRFIQTLNPMYHFIMFVRSILMDGMSPYPMRYFYCLAGALLMLAFGSFVFKRTQGKFVLYI